MAILAAMKGVPALVRSNAHTNLWLAEYIADIAVSETPADLPEIDRSLERKLRQC
ncbi:hypothetical protein [Paracoccus beibuensis]|uniref:hypothetical protein n=1 Tax=Paracoccus beibuensis TaxID=547602 RepID=UPI00223F71C9|nr:hypothetical protein [Paracoccus beibuensis]